jgi:hypothetical protein
MIKGQNFATVMVLPSSAGPMAGAEARMIMNPTTNKMTMLLPMPAGMPNPSGGKGMMIVMDLNEMAGQAGQPEVKLTQLGTHQTIAGLRCDDYEVVSGADKINMCVTSALGRFISPMASGMSGGRAPAWTRAFGDRPMFPLKVWDAKGSVAMEVTAVQRTTVPASTFLIPEGYTDMSSMMRGMGRSR